MIESISLIFSYSTLLYIGFLIFLTMGVILIKNKKYVKELQPISIIIAARNEAENLSNLLKSLELLNYPLDKFEVIIVNDRSTDITASILNQYQTKLDYRVLHIEENDPNQLTGKKIAISKGIAIAKYDLLAFTDADCILPVNWLRELNNNFTNKTDYILGFSPLVLGVNKTTFRLKNLERSIYFALAAAGLYWKIPFTSTARNMAYRKSVFEAAGGFKGIVHIKSGDDDLLLMKMMKYISKAVFIFSSDASVVSIEQPSLSAQNQNNIRRASKFRYFPLWLQITALFFFLYYLVFVYELGWVVIAQNQTIFKWVILKTVMELVFIASFLVRVRQKRLLVFYPLLLTFYPVYFIYYSLKGTLGTYNWK